VVEAADIIVMSSYIFYECISEIRYGE